MKNKKNKQRRGRSINIPTSATLYNGPGRLPQHLAENVTEVLELKAVSLFTSDVSGVIATVINSDPTGYQDWTSIAALWDDYRALCLTVEYFPYNRYSKTTTNCKPLYTVFDRDSTGALSSLNAAAQYESCVQSSVEDPWKRVLKMTDVVDAQFLTTASPSATFSFKSFQNGYSASTTYGEALVTLLVQVRGRN